ncbi:MAG: TatD family hydrolase [Methanobacteriaceae archaeon]
MIDTHCHIDFKDFDKDRDEVLKVAKSELTAIINSGTSLEGNNRVLKLSKSDNYKGFLYPSLGFHPISSGDASNKELEIAKSHIVDNIDNIVAIGEVGMDFYYVKDKEKRARQEEIFRGFAELAEEYSVPLLIHARDSERKAYNIVKEFKSIPEVIFHCYSGSLKIANQLVDSGYYMSFSTMICYSKHHQEVAKEIPVENILTETDSPYLSPFEGRNQPIYVTEAIKKIAEVKGEDFSKIDDLTEKNAKKVFKI